MAFEELNYSRTPRNTKSANADKVIVSLSPPQINIGIGEDIVAKNSWKPGETRLKFLEGSGPDLQKALLVLHRDGEAGRSYLLSSTNALKTSGKISLTVSHLNHHSTPKVTQIGQSAVYQLGNGNITILMPEWFKPKQSHIPVEVDTLHELAEEMIFRWRHKLTPWEIDFLRNQVNSKFMSKKQIEVWLNLRNRFPVST